MAIQSVIKPLYQRRLENMIDWNRQDFNMFYDYIDDLGEVLVDDSDLQEFLQKPEKETRDQKWERFVKFQKALKIKLS